VNNLQSDYFHEKALLRELILTAGQVIFFEPWESLSEKLDYLVRPASYSYFFRNLILFSFYQIKTMYVDIRTLSKHGYVLNESLENIMVS
jgi:hypothetical protein